MYIKIGYSVLNLEYKMHLKFITVKYSLHCTSETVHYGFIMYVMY